MWARLNYSGSQQFSAAAVMVTNMTEEDTERLGLWGSGHSSARAAGFKPRSVWKTANKRKCVEDSLCLASAVPACDDVIGPPLHPEKISLLFLSCLVTVCSVFERKLLFLNSKVIFHQHPARWRWCGAAEFACYYEMKNDLLTHTHTLGVCVFWHLASSHDW